MRRRDLITAAAGALVATVLAGGVAWAAIPAADGTIQACYGKIGGVVRFIDPAKGEKCSTALENAVTINAKGLKGDQGPQGAQGPQGLPGQNGTNAQDGKDGLPGKDGKDGLDGQDGVSVASEAEPTGANCANSGSKLTAVNGVTYACNGTNGTDGVNGAKGEQGIQGPEGPPGPGADVLTATVLADGSLLYSSDALSSVRLSTGFYEVTFGQNTSNCAATVSAGGHFGDMSIHPTANGSTAVGGPDDGVLVTFYSWFTTTLVDTGFHLILAC